MAKKAKLNDEDSNLTDTFLGLSFKHELTNSLRSSLSGKQTDLGNNKSVSSHYSSKSNNQGRGLLGRNYHFGFFAFSVLIFVPLL